MCYVSEWVTVAERRQESLPTHAQQWAASLTGRSTVQTVTTPPLLLSEPKVRGVALYICLCLLHTETYYPLCFCAVCEPEELLVPALPEKTRVERGYVTPQQVYNLLNAEAGQPALHDPYYILILDCRSAERWVPLGRTRVFQAWELSSSQNVSQRQRERQRLLFGCCACWYTSSATVSLVTACLLNCCQFSKILFVFLFSQNSRKICVYIYLIPHACSVGLGHILMLYQYHDVS